MAHRPVLQRNLVAPHPLQGTEVRGALTRSLLHAGRKFLTSLRMCQQSDSGLHIFGLSTHNPFVMQRIFPDW